MIDTNIALDLLVFGDARVAGLHSALERKAVQWICTPAMRDEFACVLAYPQLARWFGRASKDAAAALSRFDRLASPVDAAPVAPVSCRDPDDQKFIDLAVAHGATLLSRDAQVLRLRKRLALLGVTAVAGLPEGEMSFSVLR